VKTVIVDTTVNSTSTNFVVSTNYEWYIPAKHQPVLAFYSTSINGGASNGSGKYLSASSMGIDEIEEFSKTVSVCPNPAIENVTLTYYLQNSGKVKISAIDILGQEVYSEILKNELVGEQSEILNIQSLKRGIYFIRIETNEATASRKIILN
jgi:hypothetical protein